VLSTSTPDIIPGQSGRLHVTGQPGGSVQLYCYSRPNTDYTQARPNGPGSAGQGVTLDQSGATDFSISPGTNTRCIAQYRNNSGTRGNSVVVTVHTVLSLSAYRDGPRQYHFQGTNLPRRAGQLITLYRYATDQGKYCVPTAESDTTAKDDAGCHAIRTATAETNSSNVWRIDRTFTGSGQFYFVVRTSQTLTNARGHSNQRKTVIV
jgi:hypothetical protein